MVGDRRGGSAREAHTVLQPLSEKHISLGSNSDAISEIFPAVSWWIHIFFDDDAGSLIWDQGSGDLSIVDFSLQSFDRKHLRMFKI